MLIALGSRPAIKFTLLRSSHLRGMIGSQVRWKLWARPDGYDYQICGVGGLGTVRRGGGAARNALSLESPEPRESQPPDLQTTRDKLLLTKKRRQQMLRFAAKQHLIGIDWISVRIHTYSASQGSIITSIALLVGF